MADTNCQSATVRFKDGQSPVVVKEFQKVTISGRLPATLDGENLSKLVILPENSYAFIGNGNSLIVHGSEIHSVYFS